MSQSSFEKPTDTPPGTTHSTFVRYIDRTREYYEAQGFERPYSWASHGDVPFSALSRPLAESVVALITTANEPSPPGWQAGDPSPLRRVYSFSAGDPPDLDTHDLSWHKLVTHTDDLDSYLPIHRLGELAGEGRIGDLAPRCHSVPTEYSQRRTVDRDAPEILKRVQEDGSDVAILVPL